MVTELRIVRLVVLPPDTLLGHAGRPARFKNIIGLALVGLRDEPGRVLLTQDLIVKVRELL